MQKERRIGRLGGHTGDPRDIDVRPTATVDELEIGIERFVAARQADGKPFTHLVEEQRLIAFDAARPADLLPGPRRDEDFRLEAGCRHLSRFRYLSRENAVFDQKDI